MLGKLFGGPKLTQMSPNKTWAGAIGSIILSQFAFLIFFLNSNYKFNISIIFMQLFLSIIGQFGDILMSYVKRKNNKKDCLLYTSPSPRDRTRSRMPSSA